ncbi:UPF0489 family protein [Patescibacteria group bacterium]|nr:UPF0489 family protein [Patescibacteria group bacterium]
MENYYQNSFYLTGRRGNNAFAWDVRGEEPRLYVPALVSGRLEDLELGDEVVFEDVDEGRLRSCKGLRNFVRDGKVVVTDNHNHALWFWYEALACGVLGRGAKLVHLDQHKDMRRPSRLLRAGADLEEVFRYTNEEVNVGNYIVPAIEDGLIGSRLMVTGEVDLGSSLLVDERNKILNIDMDFFAEEMKVDFEKARCFVREHAETAALITVATSPFFIDQERAIEILTELLKGVI